MQSPLCCYAFRLKPEQEIKSFLIQFVKENNLQSPFVLSCVGSVRKATLRLASSNSEHKIVELEGSYEILSLVGTLSGSGHLHVALSDNDGHVIGGHIVDNVIVLTTAEIVIGECTGLKFSRALDLETGYTELVIDDRNIT